jgi:peptide chain release factor 2
LRFQRRRKDFAPDFGTIQRKEGIVKNLRNKKKWIEDYDKAVEMTDELQLAYEFHKEGELTAEELDEQYALVENHIDAIELRICFRMKEIL